MRLLSSLAPACLSHCRLSSARSPHHQVALAEAKPAYDATELTHARLAAQELEARAAGALAASREAATALEHERERTRLHDVELQHKQREAELQHEHERALLQQELARREQQNEQLTQLAAQLEQQVQGKHADMNRVQQATQKTDETIEVGASCSYRRHWEIC